MRITNHHSVNSLITAAVLILVSAVNMSCESMHKKLSQENIVLDEKECTIQTERLRLAFDRKTGDIVRSLDVQSQRDFISPEIRWPLFDLVMTKPYDGEAIRVTSHDFESVGFRKKSSKRMQIEFQGNSNIDVNATVTAFIGMDHNVHLSIRFHNPTDWCVASVTFPNMPLKPKLGDESEDDALLIPWRGGSILPSPGGHTQSVTEDYPGLVFSQFYAHYDSTAGMYVALDDAAGHCKEFHLKTEKERFVSMQIEHQFSEQPEETVQLPYDVVLTSFQGNWRHAADIYKKWAVRQLWCQKTLHERMDIPKFLKKGTSILIDIIGDESLRTKRLGKNLEKLPDILDQYRQQTGLNSITFVPYGWENRGMWAGINYFPAIPSDSAWIHLNRILRDRGHRSAFMTSGFLWVTKRKISRSGPAFDDTKDFERRKNMCIRNADGSYWKDDRYDQPHVRGSWKGLQRSLCHGSVDAQQTMREIFLRAAQLGVSLVSFDQEQGGRQVAPCYHADHGHPPGYGTYMWNDFRDLCQKILSEAKAVQSDFGLFIENLSELAIPYMSTHWSRQFCGFDYNVRGCEGVGLFSYLYHEYVTAIGAEVVQGQGVIGYRPHPWLRCSLLANNLVRGLIQGPIIRDVALDSEDEWVRTVRQAYLSYCHPYTHFPEYLIFGETCHPYEIHCEDVDLWYWRPDSQNGKPIEPDGPPVVKRLVRLPAVSTGCFKAKDGSVATFVANITSQDQLVTIVTPKEKVISVYQANRQFIRSSEKSEKVNLSLKPFGVRVLIMK